MMYGISPSMMRAYAAYTPEGRPTDRNRENFRTYRRSLAKCWSLHRTKTKKDAS